jgi:hypothetical protein
MADGSVSNEGAEASVMRLTRVYANASPQERRELEAFLHEIGIDVRFRSVRHEELTALRDTTEVASTRMPWSAA